MTCENCAQNRVKIINLQHELDRSQAATVREKVARQIIVAALKAGVPEHALDDVEARAFRDGKQWALDKSGQAYQVAVGGIAEIADNGDKMTVPVFLKDLAGRAEADHLFAPSTQAPSSKTATGPNPWVKGPAWNLTEQGKIFRENPARARQLAEQAGQKIPA